MDRWKLISPANEEFCYGPHDRVPDDVVCANPCENPPTIFSAMFPCDIWSRDAGYYDGNTHEFIAQKCTLLLKDCVVGTKWTARWTRRRFSSGEEFWWQPFLNEIPLQNATYTDDCRRPGDAVLSPTWQSVPAREWAQWEDQGLVTDATEHVQWTLEIFPDVTPPGGGIYATLTLTSVLGYEAVYETNALKCAGTGMEITWFRKVSADAAVIQLPCYIPVMARNAIEHPLGCDNKEDQCGCNDSGDATQSFDISWSGGCDGLEFPSRIGPLTRQNAVQIGVTYPGVTMDGGTCGIFAYVFDTGECGKEALAIIHCDGAGYYVDFYCYDSDPESPTYQEWVSQGPLTGTVYTKGCLLPHIAGTVPGFDCCCTLVCDDCADVPMPATFTVSIPSLGLEIPATSGAATVDQFAVTLEGGEGIYSWQGDFGCFGGNFAISASDDPYTCISEIASVVVLSCDPLHMEITCNCSGGGTLILVVTE